MPDLYRHLAACELTANRRRFIYVPLRHHFERNLHVTHRLRHYNAGCCMTYEEASDPDALAHAITTEIGRHVDYRLAGVVVVLAA